MSGNIVVDGYKVHSVIIANRSQDIRVEGIAHVLGVLRSIDDIISFVCKNIFFKFLIL